VLRYLAEAGKRRARREGKTFASFGFWLGSEHPVYDVARGHLPRAQEPYAVYLRVPDVPGFLRHIGAVLEERLAGSPAVGHTGELRLSFYRDGVRIVFRNGRVAKVERWEPGRPEERESAAFPGLTFVHLLFGHRSLEELEHLYADCHADGDEARVLLKALFPKQASLVWPLV
jgi:hypothetical protein